MGKFLFLENQLSKAVPWMVGCTLGMTSGTADGDEFCKLFFLRWEVGT